MAARIDATDSKRFRRLLARGVTNPLGRGDFVYREGEAADSIYAVLRGRIRLSISAPAGREVTVATVGPGELFGEECLVPEQRRLCTARAAESTTTARIPADAALRAVRTSRDAERALIHAWLTELAEARRRAAEQAFRPVPQRLARLLLELRRRFGRKEAKGTLIPHWFTHQELADLIAAHRSTVTTTLGDWLYRGILKERGRCLLILDERRLEILADAKAR
ncbi:MAG: Crp/Fnr family transcriptional regulator [Gemmatimonadetes bacterium]|nr:Crp/Fnr family transcriptional regulator [Gemmatimonadota bacterium]